MNVWGGIVDDSLTGLAFLPVRLTVEVYRNFVKSTLSQFLGDVPLATRTAMWFMHDGAPPHLILVVRNFLPATYQDHWICRGGIHVWPARSSDFISYIFSN